MNQEKSVTESRHPDHEDLTAYRDGELNWFRRAVVRRHLATCAECREEIHAMQTLYETLQEGAYPDTAFAPALRERIMAQVADIPPLPDTRRAPSLMRYGLAASLAVNCIVLFLLNRSGMVAPVSPAPNVAVPSGVSAPAIVPIPPPLHPQQPRSRAEAHGEGRWNDGTIPPRPAPALAAVRSVAKTARVTSLFPRPASERSALEKPAVPLVSAPPAALPVQSRDQTQLKTTPPIMPEAEVPLPRAAKTAPRAADQPVSDTAPNPDQAAPEESPALQAPPLSAPPPAGMVALPAAPTPPAPLVRTFAPAGVVSRKSRAERDAPLAVNPWPVLSPPIAKTVEVDWQVDEQGGASDIRFTATGIATLDTAIRDAIRQNRYLPAMKDGKPIAARMSHTFVINL